MRRFAGVILIALLVACGNSSGPGRFDVSANLTTQLCNNNPTMCPGQTTCDIFWHALATDTTTTVVYTVTYVTSVTGDTATAGGQFQGAVIDTTAWALGTISIKWRLQGLSTTFDKNGQGTVNATACTVT